MCIKKSLFITSYFKGAAGQFALEKWPARQAQKGERERGGRKARSSISHISLPFSLNPYPLPFRRQLRRILEKLKSKASTQAKEAFNLYT